MSRIAGIQQPGTDATIAAQQNTAPYLLSIGERAERIAQAFEQRQLSTQEALRQLAALVKEVTDARRAQADTNLAAEVFAVYWLLKRAEVANPEGAAEQMARVFEQYPHWMTSEAQERRVTTALYKVLVAGKVARGRLKELAQQVMQVIRRARP